MPEYVPESRLGELEAALAALQPLPAQINREHLMFRAGQRSQPRRWVWPVATALMTAATVVLAVVLLAQPGEQPAERVVYVTIKEPAPSPPPEKDALPPPPEPEVLTSTEAEPEISDPAANYFNQQRQVMRWGLEGLPPPRASSPELPLKLDNLLKKSSRY
jgi:hypothetical protein